ncbi:SusC/RagA family TonB-linked outer membrane protein [Carboxylicivirga sp. M1479]|nr:SusC/RagA family TonB-linked outer membrane protein [Carboxylicivirga sp. M1479]
MMRKYNIIYFSFLMLFAISMCGWAQTDSLNVNSKIIDQEVSIAFGKQSFGEVTSSISTVSGEELEKSSATNLGNSLYGRLPGLFVIQASGEPGKDLPWLRIRGASVNPLIIVDGYERDLSFINPEEVESISVLKDGAALAIYGMKGANGAIVVTTKRGIEQKTQISFSLQSGVQMPYETVNVLGAKDYMTMYNQAALNDGLPAKYTTDDIAAAGTSPRFPDVNWEDEVVKKLTNVSKANLGIRGGSNFIKYFVNFGFLYNDGIYKPENPDMNSNANMTRFNVRSNFDLQVTKNTVFSMDLAGSFDNKGYPANSTSEIWNAMYTLPPNAFNIKNPDGSYGGTSLLLNNPVAMLETSGRNKVVDQYLNASFKLTQDFDFITKGLSASIGYVLDHSANNSDGTWRYFQVKQIAPGYDDNYQYYTYRENTEYNNWSNAASTRFTVFDAQVLYEMPTANGHDLTFMTRFQSDKESKANTDLTPYVTNSVGGRLSYSYNNKYLFEVAASYYGSDQYAEGKRYGFFPSASAGWVFSDESFLEDSKLLSYGKLRASYGITGLNRYASGRYPYYQFYTGGGSFPIGEDWDMMYGLKPGRLANEDTKWEVSEKINMGVDLEFFKQLSFTFDYFMDKRTDVLYIDYSRPAVTGATLPIENIGEIHNTGFDTKLGFISKPGDFSWYADFMLSYFDNSIEEMGESISEGNLSHINKTGDPYNAIYGYEVEGYYEAGEDVSLSPTQTFGSVAEGDLKYRDLNGDNIIDERDMTMIGSRLANVDLGLKLGFNYKNFDLEAMFQGQLNRDITINDNAMYQPFIKGNAVTEIAKEDGFPRLSLTNMNNYQSSSYWVRSVDFIKLRNLELGYSLPKHLSSSLRMDKVRFFFRGMNILTLSDWKYTDPEFSWIGYPPMKTYYLGVNINF